MPKTTLRGVDVETSSVVVKDIKDVAELLTEIEASEQSFPILLKQYLKLGGRLLGFNIDHDFGSVLDGLIYVDLRVTDRRLLDRYMGKDRAKQFYRYHGLQLDTLEALKGGRN
jgi:hypothetical protein